MLKTHFKTALRQLGRHKGFSIINLSGLAVGLACCILIVSFILTERSFDRYHEKAGRIHRLWAVLTLGGTPNDVASVNAPPGPAMREEYPEVEEAVRFRQSARVSVRFRDREFYEDRVMYADASVFSIFSYVMRKGDPRTALESPGAVVLTESTARRYFGSSDPMGRSLRFNGRDDFRVAGIIADVPDNSHFEFDLLCSFETLVARNRQMMESWFSAFGYHTYLLLSEDADPHELEARFPAFVDRHMGEDLKGSGANVSYHLQPLTDIHLHSHMRHEIAANSDAQYITVFGAIGLFILLIACFNFMNLATARSAARAREVGVRKVLGAEKHRLIRQFLGESILNALISLAAALVLAELTLPMFSSLSDRPLRLPFAEIIWLAPALVGMALLAGLIAGSYPAFYLAAFRPVRVLQGRSRGGSNRSGIRQTLVAAQFAISLALMIATGVVFSQLRFMKDIDLGFNKRQVMVIPIHSDEVRGAVESIKARLRSHSGIAEVAASSHVPGGRRSGGAYIPEGYPEGKREMMDGMLIDHDYIATMGMDMAAGRGFERSFATDPENAILINQAAARAIGWSDAVGKTIRYSDQSPPKTVVGVVHDFHFQSPHTRVAPLYISNAPYGPFNWRALFVRLHAGQTAPVLEHLKREWTEIDPDRPFDYYFLDAAYDRQYRSDEKLSGIFTNFTLIAVFIACLGLFGMMSFAAERRTKEIGIRKVLGSSAARIVVLLGGEMIRLIAIASLITWPLTYFLMRDWLKEFPYRTGISPLIFILATTLMVMIGCATIAYQSIRSATADPVEALRYE